MAKKRSFRMSPKFFVVSLILLGGLVYSLYKVIPKTTNSIVQVPEIDVISSLEYGPVELDGYIQKDAPIGDQGNYFLSTSTGNYVNLIVEGDIEAIVGAQVHVTGILGPPVVEGGKPTLLVETMESF